MRSARRGDGALNAVAPVALHPAPRIVAWPGPQAFGPVWDAMRAFTDARDPATADELWRVEHTPVYTVGVAGRAEHLPRVDTGTPVVRTDRGGQVTWHGPGQAVVYTLVDLRRLGWTVRTLVRTLEAAIVDVLAAHGIAAAGDAARPGVYVDGAKIAALGLKLRRGCAYHGVALNVDCDLRAFDAIDPCGHRGLAVTSVARLGVGGTLDVFSQQLADRLAARLVAPPAAPPA